MHSFVNLRRQRGQPTSLLLAGPHQFADRLVGRSQRHALRDQMLHQRRRVEVAVFEASVDRLGLESSLPNQTGGEFQRQVHRVERVEQCFLVFLQVAIVGERQALDENQK